MSITRAAFESILREYNDKRLRAERALAERKAEIYSRLPEVEQIQGRIASLSVDTAIARIKGTGADLDSYRRQIEELSSRKQHLLASAGYQPSDLEPHYECRLCNDTGYIGDEMCSCFKKRIREVLYDQSNIGRVLDQENFSTFSFKYYPDEPDSQNNPLQAAKHAARVAVDFINNFDTQHDNLLICGETGVGKSFLANCIAKELIDRGYFVIYLSAVKLFDILGDAVFGSDRADSDQILKQIMKCDLLIIDDLGTELVNSFTTTQLFNCINERLLADKSTIISSNLSLEQLQNNYSERIFSRLVNRYTIIKLFGKDIRMIKKLEG